MFPSVSNEILPAAICPAPVLKLNSMFGVNAPPVGVSGLKFWYWVDACPLESIPCWLNI